MIVLSKNRPQILRYSGPASFHKLPVVNIRRATRQYSIDTQDPSSYTPRVKKKVLIDDQSDTPTVKKEVDINNSTH